MSSEETEFTKKSKGEQKREAAAAQALGTELVKLSVAQLKTLLSNIELPDNLHEALLACQKIKSHEAHRRQLQYIGKLMRDIEVEPLQKQLAQAKRGGQVETAQLHLIERWRDRLLSEGEAALNDLTQSYSHADIAQIQELVATAHKEFKLKQPPRAARQLFKYLRELIAD